MSPTVLVVAKAPVPGEAKTRLAVTIGDDRAADLAAAMLLDTLTAAHGLAGREACVVALTGDLDRAARADDLRRALAGCHVVPQRGRELGERLAAAHADTAAHRPGAVVQIGMDTPQVTTALLALVLGGLGDDDAVLGPAADGGWWVLALRDPAAAAALHDVPMSTPSTHDDTRAALEAAGLRVAGAPVVRDVDTAEDADAVALLAPRTRFAGTWRDALQPSALQRAGSADGR